ncbi:MAG: class I SAM-dependent methyltransferase [Euryarchaeota archaeon]|nr:class I SAM-dependent methyltransferase [Euryarchaeota archaeon]MCG2737232.1 class I SAM-dependent methyltransferase [Candidatus Methanoperedenaceae archaeon]
MKCNLCSSDSVFPIEFLKHATRVFLRCPQCDLIFVPESHHLIPEEEVSRYKLHRNTLSNEGYVGMFLEKIAMVHQYCHGVKSVLDYGCGPGPVLAELLKREGFSCDIYDPFFFPDFPDGFYDLVISTEVFEHLRDTRAELQRICKLIKPGGYLAVMTSMHDDVGDFENWWYKNDPTHICFFGARTFEWIANDFGFRIIYTNKKNFIILQLTKK